MLISLSLCPIYFLLFFSYYFGSFTSLDPWLVVRCCVLNVGYDCDEYFWMPYCVWALWDEGSELHRVGPGAGVSRLLAVEVAALKIGASLPLKGRFL